MSATTTNEPGPTKAETLRGGSTIDITMDSGDKRPVQIRQLPIREFERWLAVMDDEPRAAELFTGNPEGWADTLSAPSLEAVILEGERINRDFFERWLVRRTARKEWLAPVLARNAALAASLPTGSPNSPSTPG